MVNVNLVDSHMIVAPQLAKCISLMFVRASHADQTNALCIVFWTCKDKRSIALTQILWDLTITVTYVPNISSHILGHAKDVRFERPHLVRALNEKARRIGWKHTSLKTTAKSVQRQALSRTKAEWEAHAGRNSTHAMNVADIGLYTTKLA